MIEIKAGWKGRLMKPMTILLLGAAMGLVLASSVYLLFSFVITYVYSDLVISGITLVL